MTPNKWRASVPYMGGLARSTCGRDMLHALCSVVFLLRFLVFLQLGGATWPIVANRMWGSGGMHPRSLAPKHPCNPCNPSCSLSVLCKNSTWLRQSRKGLVTLYSLLEGELASWECVLQILCKINKQACSDLGTAYCSNWPVLGSTPPQRLLEHCSEIKSMWHGLSNR